VGTSTPLSFDLSERQLKGQINESLLFAAIAMMIVIAALWTDPPASGMIRWILILVFAASALVVLLGLFLSITTLVGVKT